MRISDLLTTRESVLTSTMIIRLFALTAPNLTPVLLNCERQSSGLVRQPQVS